MKVLRVISSMNPLSGGPCQGIRNAVPELSKLGVYTQVVCLDSPDESFLKNDSFPIVALGPSKSSWFYTPKLLPWLMVNLVNFDMVIVHGLWQYHGYAVNKAINAMRRNKVKVPKFYVMPHGMLDPYFQNASDRKIKAIRNRLYWTYIESRIINNADGILFTSQTELILARETFKPYEPKQELNIGYGIETPPVYNEKMQKAFKDKCPEIGNNSFVLFLSRIHQKKGVDLLIQAYITLYKKRGTNEVLLPYLVIAGPGIETSYGLSLKKMVDNNPEIKDRIFFTGMLNGDSKWGAFYECEAYILPSHQENFGISVAEALACGKPVLISDQINIWNEIISAGAGIVAKDSLEGTEKLLSEWVSLNKDKKVEMGMKAMTSFKKDFAILAAASRFAHVLN